MELVLAQELVAQAVLVGRVAEVELVLTIVVIKEMITGAEKALMVKKALTGNQWVQYIF